MYGNHLRQYLAGTGVTGALIGAAVVAFLAIGALVGFEGLPLASGDRDEGSVTMGARAGAPEAAAVALAAAPSAVAAPTGSADAGAGAADAVVGDAGGDSSATTVAGDPSGALTTTGDPVAGSPDDAQPPPVLQDPRDPAGTTPVGDTIDSVDGLGRDLGLPPVGSATDEIAGSLDETIGGALENSP